MVLWNAMTSCFHIMWPMVKTLFGRVRQVAAPGAKCDVYHYLNCWMVKG